MSYNSATASTRDYLCPGVGISTAAGGSVSTAPRGTNISPSFAAWSPTGTITYDSASQEMRLATGTGDAWSPLIRIDEATSVTIKFDSYSTVAVSHYTPNGGIFLHAYYYGADGSTLVNNSIGYNNNGRTQATALSTWVPTSWTTPTGGWRYLCQSTPADECELHQ